MKPLRQKRRTKKAKPFVPNKSNQQNGKELTTELLIDEALIAGVSFFEVYDYTFGELVQIVHAKNERERRKNQASALIAKRQAELITMYIADKGADLKIYDIFPFWTNEERKEMLIEEYKNKMLSIAAKGR